jgi:cytochrome b561
MASLAQAPYGVTQAQTRYSAVAMWLHWILAATIIFQIGFAWYMDSLEDHSPLQGSIEKIHISLGLTILILTLCRIAWAIYRRPPSPMPAARWERVAAVAVHKLLYVLMLVLPLSGWVMESLGRKPIPFWGAVWPHFPGLPGLLQGQNTRAIKETIEEWHGSPLVWAMIALVVLHVAGAIKHQFDGRPVLWRMAPFLKPPA